MSTSPAPSRPGTRILVVCTGNVCRSPLIERLLQAALDDAFEPGAVDVGSAGTGALVGAPMDERAARVLQDLGGNAEDFIARRLEPRLVANASLVLTATREHRAAVVRLHPRALCHTFTVRELAALLSVADAGKLPADPAARVAALAGLARQARGRLPRQNLESLDIVDPYRRTDDVYALMRAQVAPSVRVICDRLVVRSGNQP